MPVHNAAATLERSLDSVRAQSFGDWELLLTDDGSGDGSAGLAAAFAAGDPRIRLLRHPVNRGAAAARNTALEAAQGRFIAFLDADDLWHPDKLARQIPFMQAAGAALSFTGYARVDRQGRVIARVAAPDRVDYPGLLRRNHIGCLTAVYDRARTGCQPMPDLRRQHDYALWLRLVRLYGPARGLDAELATYRVAPGSLSSDKGAAARDMWRVLRGCEGLALPAALAAFGRYAAFGLRHRLVQRARPDSASRN